MYQVLLVDDDQAARYIMKRFDWQSNGFSVAAEAADGREALEKLAQMPLLDLIVTDIRMPGMDGMELLQELQVEAPGICIILLSTFNDFEYAQRGIRYGVLDYMTKPVHLDELSRALQRAACYIKEHPRQSGTVRNDSAQNAAATLPEYFTTGRETNRIILAICEFVVSHVEQGIGLDDIAVALDLSPDYVGHLFKKETGLSFISYSTRVKMEQAKNLLRNGHYKNYEVSEILGYKTPDYFAQLFKKYTGSTPMEYRLAVHDDYE
jgi:two-component system, response regulator YesN